VMGCNEAELAPQSHRIISSSICDAVALSPIADLIMRTVGLESGHLVTLHPWLGDQNLLDRPFKLWFDPGEEFSNYALGRAAPNNLIPKVTTAVRAASKVVAGLGEVLGCFSYRVPTSIVSSAVLTVRTREFTTRDRILELLHEYVSQQQRPILELIDEPLISSDFIGNEHSAIIDKRWVSVVGGRHLRLMYWYDNEWGYSSRVVDLVSLLGDWYQRA
jgi:glyceraldehyde 3-phosphate dehydrogenase